MSRVLAIACALGIPAAALSQPAAPAPAPAPDYSGAVYADGRGCAFQRAEIGGEVVWAERLDANGAPLCGLAPTDGVSGSPAVAPVPPHRRGSVPDLPAAGRYAQVAAFRDLAEADALTTQLQVLGFAVLRQDFARQGLRVIFAGPLGDRMSAEAALADIRALGYADAFLRVAP